MATPYSPIPTSARRLWRPFWAPRSRSGTQSLRHVIAAAILITSAPVDCMAWTRAARSAGTPSKVWADRTIRRPPAPAITSSNCARHSMSTYSAPSDSASVRIRRRSSSAPVNPPPSHAGRQVMITGRRLPARAPATLGSLTESSRSSIRSASTTASRFWRSSAVVAAVTVTHRSGFDTVLNQPSAVSAICNKKSPFNRSAEEARKLVCAVAAYA